MVIALAKIDKIATIVHYTIRLVYSKEGYQINPIKVITNTLLIPKFISWLVVYFSQVKPKKGKSYAKLHFTYLADLDDIIDNLKEELSNYSFIICKQVL